MRTFTSFPRSVLPALWFVVVACSGSSFLDDGGSDRVSPADTIGSDAAQDAPAPQDRITPSDTSAVDVVGTDIVGSDTARTDALGDSPAGDTSLGPCSLPNGGTCARGSTCPAGDGCNDCTCPATGGAAMCTARPCAFDAGRVDVPADRTTTGCSSAADCRLFSSYCATAPCECIVLQPGERDPPCTGGMVSCFVDPCARARVACVAGVCIGSP